MKQKAMNHVKIFAVETTISSFHSYIICAAQRINDNEIRGESFLLYISKGTKARLVAMEIVVPHHAELTFFSDLDEAFVIEECLHQGKMNLLDINKNKMNYDYRPAIKSIFEVDMAYFFHGIFANENVRNKLKLIGDITQIEELKRIQIVNNYTYANFKPMEIPLYTA